MAGSANLKLESIDRSRREFNLFNHFRCDWAIGDTTRQEFSLFEFEDARMTSIFAQGDKYHDEWGRRIEHGFPQVVDWVWCLDAYRATPDYVRNFGHGDAKFFAMIVLGRSKFVNASVDQKNRFKWRNRHVAIHGVQVEVVTFDELLEF